MVLSTEWSQVEVIDLVNDGNGLGFILVGGRSTGVVIKALTPGGVAERDGRLQCGDHLLQIGDVNLRGFSSEQVATVLRSSVQTGAQVRLIVARPVEPTTTEFQTMACHAPIIPTKLLSDPEELSRHLFQNPNYATTTSNIGNEYFLTTTDTELADLPLPPIPIDISSTTTRMCPKDLDIVPFAIVSSSPHQSPLKTAVAGTVVSTSGFAESMMEHIETVIADIFVGTSATHEIDADNNESDRSSIASSTYIDSPETETYVVELHKNVYGLGITVAGYVCEEEDLSGIFVKSIIEGSAAEMSGQIQINDRIVAVDGKTLAGVTNHQAVEILRNTDIEVHLTLERFLRGRKFEHLQVALTELKGDTQSQISLPASPSIATLSWLPPKSDADSIATDGGLIIMDFVNDIPSRDTVDSNMSHMLDKSDQSTSSGGNHEKIPSTPENNIQVEGSVLNVNSNGINSVIAMNVCGVDIISQNQQTKLGNGVTRMPLSEENLQSITSNRTATTTPTNPLSKLIGELPSEIMTTSNAHAFALASSIPTTISTPICTPSAESLKVSWKSEFPESEIIVAEINKLSGLGISLEGTVDVECGIEKRPHHYIRSILEDGPVGRQGILKPGDELLQVNEFKLQGLKHIEVVKILKELPSHVKLVCARGSKAPSVINTSQNPEAFETRSLLPGGHQSLQNLLTKAQSESSLYTSSTATLTDQQRSRSLENVSGLALWSTNITIIEIEKTEQGFGFSILDYQDPMDPEGSVIVIRGLIREGSAEATNEIFPGDRLVSVGEHSLQGLNLDEAVTILKGMPPGITKLGICRPLSTSDSNIASPVGDGDSPSA